jgi:hypothetical protein
MCCLSWLLNLGYAGSPGVEPTFIGHVNFTLTSFVLPSIRLYDTVFPTSELKRDYRDG